MPKCKATANQNGKWCTTDTTTTTTMTTTAIDVAHRVITGNSDRKKSDAAQRMATTDVCQEREATFSSTAEENRMKKIKIQTSCTNNNNMICIAATILRSINVGIYVWSWRLGALLSLSLHGCQRFTGSHTTIRSICARIPLRRIHIRWTSRQCYHFTFFRFISLSLSCHCHFRIGLVRALARVKSLIK